ncbi:MAG: argininosuccinate lyase [Flavitalea sp.]
MKLWSKENTDTPALIEQFTVGNDKDFDLLLAEHDVKGTIAHVTMLKETGLMDAKEAAAAIEGLHEIEKEIKNSTFSIEEGVEDIHSQVELLLTKRIGEAGKMIHSGRSRNDQVAVDIKLFLRAEIIKIKNATNLLFDLLIEKSEENKNILLPGYTHLQIAMPSSAGLWLSAYAESLVDDMELLAAAFVITNKNPLGSGAGYGSSFPLNRSLTTKLLGFETMNYNSVYAQMGRGKTEKIVSQSLASVAATISKLAMDCTLYLNQNFGFISFPEQLTTGSSIMPHKKNPDVFELIRAHCNRLQAVPNELVILTNNLPSGYHRDLQLTKEILFPAFGELKRCITMTELMISNISFKKDSLEDEKYKYLFSVEAVNQLVNNGVPFREAYKTIGNQIDKGEFTFDFSKGLHHTHEGSIGNLCNKEIKTEMEKVLAKFP